MFVQFVRFANIEEDTPSYHTRYDFFVSKFSSMCHSSPADTGVRDSIRLAGIKGLQVSLYCILPVMTRIVIGSIVESQYVYVFLSTIKEVLICQRNLFIYIIV